MSFFTKTNAYVKKTVFTVTGFDWIKSLFFYIKNDVTKNVSRFKERVDEARAFKNNGYEQEQIPHDKLMEMWGIEEKDKPKIIRSFRLAQLLFIGFCFFVLFNIFDIVSWANPFMMLFVALSCFLTSATYILIYEWKVRLIKSGKPFVPFLVWLFSFD